MKSDKMQHKTVIPKTRGKETVRPMIALYEMLCRQQCREGNLSKHRNLPQLRTQGSEFGEPETSGL